MKTRGGEKRDRGPPWQRHFQWSRACAREVRVMTRPWPASVNFVLNLEQTFQYFSLIVSSLFLSSSYWLYCFFACFVVVPLNACPFCLLHQVLYCFAFLNFDSGLDATLTALHPLSNFKTDLQLELWKYG